MAYEEDYDEEAELLELLEEQAEAEAAWAASLKALEQKIGRRLTNREVEAIHNRMPEPWGEADIPAAYEHYTEKQGGGFNLDTTEGRADYMAARIGENDAADEAEKEALSAYQARAELEREEPVIEEVVAENDEAA